MATPARSRLDSVTECGEVDCFAPTTFTYTAGAGGWSGPYSGGLGVTVPTMAHAHAGDFSGDGRDDVAYFDTVSDAWQVLLANATNTFDLSNTNCGSGATNYYQGALQIDLNGDGKRDLLTPQGTSPTWYWLRQSSTGTWQCSNTQVAATGWNGNSWVVDVDGDGLEDVIFVSGTQMKWLRNTGGALDPATPPVIYTVPSGWAFTSRPFGVPVRPFVDFDGDGRGDVVVAQVENPGDWTVISPTESCQDTPCQNCSCLSNLCTQNPPDATCEATLTCNTWTGGATFKIWGCEGAYRYELLYGTDSGFTAGTFLSTVTLADMRPGDFNGDGLSDLYYQVSGKWWIQFSKGVVGQFSATNTNQSSDASTTIATDWDGDGKTDLLSADSGTGNWFYLRSTGQTLEGPQNANIPATGASSYPKVLDSDGKGLPDLFYVEAGNEANRRLHSGSVADLLDIATDGFSNTVNFAYASLSDSTYYTKGTDAVFPVQDYQSAAKIVRQYQHSNGVGGVYSMNYTYEGARVHLQGRGFVGFSKRTVTDTRLGNYTVESYEQDPDAWEFLGALSSATTRTKPTAVPPAPADAKIVEVTQAWESLPSDTGESRRFPFIHIKTVKNYEINTVNGAANPQVSTVQMTVSVDGDNFGTAHDIVVVTTEKNTGINSNKIKTEQVTHTAIDNDSSAANWCVGRPTTTLLINSHQLADGAEVTRTIGHDWNPGKCRLDSETLEPGDEDELKTVYGYDGYGNINLISVQPAGPEPLSERRRDTDINWGTDGRFPVTVENPLNQVTQLDWDPDRGVLLTATDPNELPTSWTYDDLDRRFTETRPDGTSTRWDYFSCSSDADCSGMANATYKLRTQLKKGSTIVSEGFTVHDAFDRLRRTSRYQLAGGLSDVLTEWRASGLPYRQSQPYFNVGGTGVWTTLTEDALGRVTKAERADTNDHDATVAATTIVYEGLTTTVTDPPIGSNPGMSTTRIDNAWGTVARVIDHDGNDVDYEYDAFANLTTTRDAAGNEIVLGYNLRGFKISSSDPDMGSGSYAWSYDYYPTGELRSQTDANENSVSFVYDKLGRPTKRTEAEGDTDWTWGIDPLAHNIGQLEKVVTGWGYEESYVYDAYGRPYTFTTKINGASYLFDYRYSGTTGLLQDLYYPTTTGFTRFRLRYEFDTANKSGMLKRLADFTGGAEVKEFWQADTTDAFGQYMDVNLDDGDLQTFIDFDSITGAPNAITSGAAGGSEMQELVYTWNEVGRLTKREDQNQGTLNEAFFYDHLYRLDYSQLNGSPTPNVDLEYNAIGNITKKTDVNPNSWSYTNQAGCPAYTHTQPHAVRKVGTTIYCYDANGNMTKRGGDDVTWYSYNLPQSIEQGSNTSTLYYGAGRQRYKQVANGETTLYVGGLFEKITEAFAPDEYKLYIVAGGQRVAVETRRSDLTSSTSYLLPDHLGSVDTIVDSGGTWTNLSYDAFGKRRRSDWTSNTPDTAEWTAINATTHRGFTGHEHLDSVGLVHMNGRVYDPAIGRFLSADPFVTEPFNQQNLNRYSYVNNDPLSWVDPSGFDTEMITSTYKKCTDNCVSRVNLGNSANPFAETFYAKSGHAWQPLVGVSDQWNYSPGSGWTAGSGDGVGRGASSSSGGSASAPSPGRPTASAEPPASPQLPGVSQSATSGRPRASDRVGPPPWGPGYLFGTLNEAVLDASELARLQEHSDPLGRRRERGTDFLPGETDGVYYRALSIGTTDHVDVPLSPAAIAWMHTHTLGGGGDTAGNRFLSPGDWDIVNLQDPLHRPAFLAGTDGAIRRFDYGGARRGTIIYPIGAVRPWR